MEGKGRFILACLAVALVGFLAFPAFAAPTKVTFWYSYGGRNKEVTEELIKRFNESQSDYQVVGSFQGDYFEALAKFRVAVLAKAAPTLIHTIPETLPQLWESGVLENLEPYAKGKNPVNLNDYVFALSQDGYWDYIGKKVPLFAIPFNRSTPIMYTNKDMLDKKGVAIPDTWDELRDAAAKLTVIGARGKTEVYGFEVPIDWWFWIAMVHQAGGRLMNEDGTKAVFKKEGAEALQYWVDMVNKYKYMKYPPGKDYNSWTVANNDFINQRAGIIWTSTAFITYLTENSPFKVQCAFLPKKVKRAVPSGGTFFVVWKGAEEKEKEGAWAFLKWMTELDQTIYWSQHTGYMPVRTSAINSSKMAQFYQKNPNFKVSLGQLPYTFTYPFSSALIEIDYDIVVPNLLAPVIGLKSVEEAMEYMVEESNKCIAKTAK